MSISIVIDAFTSLVIEWVATTYQNVIIFQDGCQKAVVCNRQSCCIAGFSGGHSWQILNDNIRYCDANGDIWELNSHYCLFSVLSKMATLNELFWLVFQKQLEVVRW